MKIFALILLSMTECYVDDTSLISHIILALTYERVKGERGEGRKREPRTCLEAIAHMI